LPFSNGGDAGSNRKEFYNRCTKLDGGFGVNIITKKLRVQLSLSKPKLAPYNLHMVD
jgi:hypothetical protein